MVQLVLDHIVGYGPPYFAVWQKHFLDSSKCISDEWKEQIDDLLKLLKIASPVSKAAPKKRTQRKVLDQLRYAETPFSDNLMPEDEEMM